MRHSRFFTGCSITDACNAARCNKRFSIDNVFSKWNEKATVRSAPRRILELDNAALDLFPRNLIPVVSHGLFKDKYLHCVGELSALQLHRYLNFTINLEMMVVNENIRQLLLSANELGLGSEERIALHRIYVDEGYHALFCADFSRQVETVTGIGQKFHSRPAFMHELSTMTAGQMSGNVASLVFLCVAETLITHNLIDVASSKSVPHAVNDIMRDHARDEALHHNFFKRLLIHFYRNNTADFHNYLHLIPQSIMAFIAPDKRALRLALLQIGVQRDDAVQILEETYGGKVVSDYARYAARDLLDWLKSECAAEIQLQDALHNYNLN